MNDGTYMPDADYFRTMETLRSRAEMGPLTEGLRNDTLDLIRSLNPGFNPDGPNVSFLRNLESRLGE